MSAWRSSQSLFVAIHFNIFISSAEWYEISHFKWGGGWTSRRLTGSSGVTVIASGPSVITKSRRRSFWFKAQFSWGIEFDWKNSKSNLVFMPLHPRGQPVSDDDVILPRLKSPTTHSFLQNYQKIKVKYSVRYATHKLTVSDCSALMYPKIFQIFRFPVPIKQVKRARLHHCRFYSRAKFTITICTHHTISIIKQLKRQPNLVWSILRKTDNIIIIT